VLAGLFAVASRLCGSDIARSDARPITRTSGISTSSTAMAPRGGFFLDL
jgi:hypothetical protein